MTLIDSSVGSKQFASHPRLKSLGFRLGNLDSADVWFLGNGPEGKAQFAVEIKSLSDLVQSIAMGRLMGHQVPKMIDAGYDFRTLLYYGLYREASNGLLQEWNESRGRFEDFQLGSRLIYADHMEYVLNMLYIMGFQVKHTIDEEGAANWIASYYEYFSKKWDTHTSYRVFNEAARVPKLDLDRKIHFLASLAIRFPQLGIKRAIAAAEKFKTPRRMFASTEQDWLELPRVGKVVAREIMKKIDGE